MALIPPQILSTGIRLDVICPQMQQFQSILSFQNTSLKENKPVNAEMTYDTAHDLLQLDMMCKYVEKSPNQLLDLHLQLVADSHAKFYKK